jgi:hypothetical protein
MRLLPLAALRRDREQEGLVGFMFGLDVKGMGTLR